MKMDPFDSAQTNVEREWIGRARALKPLLETAAPRIEQAKMMPPDVLQALRDAQMLRMTTPRSVGGAELDLATYAQVVATIAEGDASTAWCIAQISGSSMCSAYLDPGVAKEVFGSADSAFTWGFAGAKSCRAAPVKDGWIVNGEWTFASGNRICQWLGAHAQLCDEEGKPRFRADGRPLERTMLLPRSSATVNEDVWDVIGLIGTGSDSYSVTDLFVPEKYSVVPRGIGRDQQLPEGATAEPEPERRESGVLYKHTGQAAYQVGLSSVAIGIARATLDAFIALAKEKSPSSAVRPLRDDSWIQARIAQADAKISAASAWLIQLLREAWHECATRGQMSFPLRVKIRAACTHQINEARDAVDMIYAEAGATAIFRSNAFERRFRDMHTVSQQVQGSIARMQSVGQYYLGTAPQLFLLP
jgi:alkylation response protein AidB-like acyl-CoA dehydrogenase